MQIISLPDICAKCYDFSRIFASDQLSRNVLSLIYPTFGNFFLETGRDYFKRNITSEKSVAITRRGHDKMANGLVCTKGTGLKIIYERMGII